MRARSSPPAGAAAPVQVFSSFAVAHPRLLLVAATGGHLTQLVRLAEAAGVAGAATWVTFDSPQSRSLLRGRRVVWVEYVAPRDVRGVWRAARVLEHELDPADFDGVVSTGAAVALAGFVWGRRHRIPRRYIESVSRTDGPSLTGRITRALRLAETFTQHASWASASWPLTQSVLHGFAREPRATAGFAPAQASGQGARRPLEVLVTLGTIRPYRFDRLVDRVREIVGPGDRVVWQLGVTSRDDLPGETHELMGMEDLLAAARRADVVVTHAGVGTILQLLDEGISPVVVPRRPEHDEHVDGHQAQIWGLLASSGIAHPVQVEQLDLAVLVGAATHRTVRKEVALAAPTRQSAESAAGVFISWTRENGRTVDLARELGFEAHFVYCPSLLGLPGRYARQLVETRRLLRRTGAARIVLMLPPAPALLALAGRPRRRACAIVCDLHTGFFSDPKWAWAHRPALWLMRRWGITGIVTNAALQRVCDRHGVRALVLHDMIGEVSAAGEHGNYVVCPLSYANDEPVSEILGAARLTPDVGWRLTGRAPDRVSSAAPANVVFTGFIDDDAYGELLRRSLGVVALTTRPHTMQRAGYEAFSLGVPQVTSPFPELREFYCDSAEYANADAASIAGAVRGLVTHRDSLVDSVVRVRRARRAEQSGALRGLRQALKLGSAPASEQLNSGGEG